MTFRKETVILDRRYVPRGTLIVKEGEDTFQAYLIQSGEVRVFTRNDDCQEVELSRLGVGQIFGEMAMIFDGPRTASVEATKDCNLIVISRGQFQEKLEEADATIRAIVGMLSRRIVDSNNSLAIKRTDVEALRETVNATYQNILFSLPEGERDVFKSKIFSKLRDFMDALEPFMEE